MDANGIGPSFDSTRLNELCGVRVARGGPLHFVDTAGQRLVPGQLVAVEGLEPGGTLGTVVVAPGQLVDGEGVEVAGSVLRVATADDVRVFGRRAAEPLMVAVRARVQEAAPGGDLVAEDVWLSPDRARVFVACRGSVGDGRGLERELTRQFGLPVSLVRQGAERSASAALGALDGLPSEWDDWIVPPGAEPVVGDDAATGAPSAGELIEQLFPPAERQERRPRDSRGRRGSAPARDEEAGQGEDEGRDAEEDCHELSG
jgi:hypothetical protein